MDFSFGYIEKEAQNKILEETSSKELCNLCVKDKKHNIFIKDEKNKFFQCSSSYKRENKRIKNEYNKIIQYDENITYNYNIEGNYINKRNQMKNKNNSFIFGKIRITYMKIYLIIYIFLCNFFSINSQIYIYKNKINKIIMFNSYEITLKVIGSGKKQILYEYYQ